MRWRPIGRFAASSLQALAVLLVSAPNAEAAAGSPKYYGGHVITHVQVVPVLWGDGVAADVANGAQKFYATIVDSPYLDWLGEYDTVGLNGAADGKPGSQQRIRRGTVLPTVKITPNDKGTAISDAQIQAELRAQIAAGALPPPHADAEGGVDTLYMIAFPPALKVSDFGGSDVCSGACAYHWTVTVPSAPSGVPYGVVPDCGSGATNACSHGSVFETYTANASHELVEAITDPECGLGTGLSVARPIGWFDPAQPNQEGEIADICLDASAFVPYLGYTVQASWSQRLAKCITNDASLTLCTGKNRPCAPCKAGDCSGAAPYCDTNMDSPTWGQCVASASGGAGGGDGGGSGSGQGGSSPPGGTSIDGGASGGNDAPPAGGGSSGGSGASSGCTFSGAAAPSSGAIVLVLAAFARAAARRRRVVTSARSSPPRESRS